MNGDRLRAFVALMPDAASRDALHALPVTRGARRPPPAQLHMTLAFIGAIERERCDALAAHLPALAAAHALPPMPVERIAWWPSLPRARLIVAELAVDAACVALNAGLAALLCELGVPADRRPFRPHVTLARLPHDAVGQPAHGGAPGRPVDVRVEALTLFESRLSHEGVSHRPIVSVPIARADDSVGA
ncbi:RNA 2',3'-cyclic phosphodiesterase [Burkholderia cenocepacia]|uniref:RNA 2',3'-cyclic phosphodiesterase n=1 Tax=Burkholderia cenocepacia (strain ATCC BAA-245 / DSM 16553 / LMG 16656 / NCTC 13227 / J2315 / CF5610) TaxID=216591 RepID=B4E615_BURCJ|nr:RNA 2',3'-cyclic phosphodiesterase [Burkholderia cenocepacia]KIS48553.1 2'-5' RNA ligase [Burkholderia cepacia]EPZ86118.1 2'-5' RNA ligase [Burkholderia cenocepacia K56-2Valvano]KKI82146.1 2'-5' RNA ligase [Burkholderia cenocepacia]MBR8385392.1 RNA 2',3'-cyclic phosphodiesterase [Burkholderia cenocepacia]MCW3660167.1 RNA 2',3'-cyclic phosphodiesterase [Burkholderia cenocepacia]